MAKKVSISSFLDDAVQADFKRGDILERLESEEQLTPKDLRVIDRFQKCSDRRNFWMNLYLVRGLSRKAQMPDRPDIILVEARRDISRTLEQLQVTAPDVRRDLSKKMVEFLKTAPEEQKFFSDLTRAWDQVSSYLEAQKIIRKMQKNVDADCRSAWEQVLHSMQRKKADGPDLPSSEDPDGFSPEGP